jgi:hypothetical protein
MIRVVRQNVNKIINTILFIPTNFSTAANASRRTTLVLQDDSYMASHADPMRWETDGHHGDSHFLIILLCNPK